MDLGDIRTAIGGWIGTVTGLPVRRKNQSQEFGLTQMVLHLTGFRGLGYDDIEELYDAATVMGADWGGVPGGFTPSQRGQRVATLEIRCETESQEDDEDALYYVQLVRDSIALPEVQVLLEAADCAFGPILLEPTDISALRNMRQSSIAQMDVAVNAAANTDGTPYGQIETAEVTVEGRMAEDDTNPRFSTTFTYEVGE